MESVTAKKKFCCPLHRVYWNRAEKLKAELAQIKEYNSNPFVNAARGRDKDGTNKDEAKAAKAAETPAMAPGAPKTLEELKAMCPKELTGFDRSLWIAEERKKYNL